MRVQRSRRVAALVVVAVALVASAATAATANGPTRPHSAKQSDNLAGVTLHFGDQLNIIHSILTTAGEDKNIPYDIEWSTFVGGPAVIAAMNGGSVDIGFMAETPTVFAQAAGNPIKVVAASRTIDPKASSYAIVVKPDSSIRTVADLKGKKVAIATGTITQYLLLGALKKAGLKPTDVDIVNFSGISGNAAFENGDVDAAATSDPFLSKYLTQKQARIVTTGAGITPGFSYITARTGALSDKKLSAAIGDFVTRLARAYVWWNAHPEVVAQQNADLFKISLPAAQAAAKRAPAAYVPIDSTFVDAQQAEANVFQQLGVITQHVDAKKLFDTRYNKLIAAVNAAKGG